jgi:xylulokinase
VINSHLKLLHEAKVDFDADLAKYGVEKGVLTNASEDEIFAPVAMWLEALDLVLQRLAEQGLDFSAVTAASGAGMQHGTVFWGRDGERILGMLDSGKPLLAQMGPDSGAFSHAFSPNWQDASTQAQCERFDAALGGPEMLARITGSKAHHRFSGPQILRFRERNPGEYARTERISLVSSFLASVLAGKVVSIDKADVCGMNLWDIEKEAWNTDLLELVAGGTHGVPELRRKLGNIATDGGASVGNISKYFVARYGFAEDCSIVPFTGDNPATIISLPLRENDAIVSLGTSTTFLMSTPHYRPDPSYHFMNHPTTSGLYMFMLCYKNGGLAREQIRDAVNNDGSHGWDKFNGLVKSTPPLNQHHTEDPASIGLFFPRPEIVPNVSAGTWRYQYTLASHTLNPVNSVSDSNWSRPNDDARAILESQFLSMRLRAKNLVSTPAADQSLPPQPSRIYLVGGGSLNSEIARVCCEVLGGAEGLYRLDIGGNACALGAAYKAVWGCERGENETFEAFVGKRWKEEGFVKKVADGYQKGVWEKYGQVLEGFEQMEKEVVKIAGV